MGLLVEYHEDFEPQSAIFTLELRSALTDSQREALERLLTGWYHVAAYGGFGSPGPDFMSDVGFTNSGEPRVEWWVDFGGAGDEVLQGLVRCVEGFAELAAPDIKRLVIGGTEQEL